MAGLTDSTILHFNVFENNGNALAYAHFSDNAAGARDDANLPENSIIVMDNLPFHRHARVIEMMQIRGWEWRFLPPYSPFLNPIECLFSQWKNHVKRSEPEDLEELDAATREVINVVTADDGKPNLANPVTTVTEKSELQQLDSLFLFSLGALYSVSRLAIWFLGSSQLSDRCVSFTVYMSTCLHSLKLTIRFSGAGRSVASPSP